MSWSFATPLALHCIGGLTMSPEKMNAINHSNIQTYGIIFPHQFCVWKMNWIFEILFDIILFIRLVKHLDRAWGTLWIKSLKSYCFLFSKKETRWFFFNTITYITFDFDNLDFFAFCHVYIFLIHILEILQFWMNVSVQIQLALNENLVG